MSSQQPRAARCRLRRRARPPLAIPITRRRARSTLPHGANQPGAQDPSFAGYESAFQNPPPTDVNGMPQFWASFNLAPKRIQNGGWARQITSDDFKISSTIAGVNMRLGRNGVRELHWHQQAEWAIVTYGNCRITILDQDGRPEVADLKEGGLWYFPAGLPHSLQGLDPDGTEFVIAFDNGDSSEFNTLLVTDWLAHTPPEVLAKNFGLPEEAFKNIPVHNKWIYQSNTPVPPLATVEAQMAAEAGKPPNPFVFRAEDFKEIANTKSGTVRLANSTNFLVSKTIAATAVTIKPGGLRDMHWHPRAPSEPIESDWDSRIGVDLLQASAGLEAGRDGRSAFDGCSQTCVGRDC
jgi:oxalate decarboxylase